MASPRKRRPQDTVQCRNFFKEAFTTAAKTHFSAVDLFPTTVQRFLRLLARSHNTTTEMLLCALLPSCATCIAPSGRLKIRSFGNHSIPCNLYLIGVGEPGTGKSPAFDIGMAAPLRNVSDNNNTKLMISEFSKPALLDAQVKSAGKTLICADEVAHSLLMMLRRSATTDSGERQLLLTLWGGRGHSVDYVSKASRELEKSGLCIGGFTQPDRVFDILTEIYSCADGLTERCLIWYLPGKLYSKRKLQTAFNSFQEDYTLKGLSPLLEEIYAQHAGEDEVLYTLTPIAQARLDNIHDSLINALRSGNAAIIADSDSETDEDDLPSTQETEIANTLGLKYIDQLGRLAVNLHVLTTVLEQMLTHQGKVTVVREISLATLVKAQHLLDHLIDQAGVMKEAHIHASSTLAMSVPTSDLSDGEIWLEIKKKAIFSPGSIVSVRDLQRKRFRSQTVNSRTIQNCLAELESEQLGEVTEARKTHDKRSCIIFVKKQDVSSAQLKPYGITLSDYKQQYNLPLPESSSLTHGRPNNPEPGTSSCDLQRNPVPKPAPAKSAALPDLNSNPTTSETGCPPKSTSGKSPKESEAVCDSVPVKSKAPPAPVCQLKSTPAKKLVLTKSAPISRPKLAPIQPTPLCQAKAAPARSVTFFQETSKSVPSKSVRFIHGQTAPTPSTKSAATKSAPTKPTKSAPTKPTKPALTKPTKPTPTKPTKPAPSKPTKPAPTKPTKPALTKPAKPARTQPTKLAQNKPTKPTPTIHIKPAPAKATKSTPAKPTKSAPTRPTKPAPTEPTKSTPAKAVPTNPVPVCPTPAQSLPSNCPQKSAKVSSAVCLPKAPHAKCASVKRQLNSAGRHVSNAHQRLSLSYKNHVERMRGAKPNVNHNVTIFHAKSSSPNSVQPAPKHCVSSNCGPVTHVMSVPAKASKLSSPNSTQSAPTKSALSKIVPVVQDNFAPAKDKSRPAKSAPCQHTSVPVCQPPAQSRPNSVVVRLRKAPHSKCASAKRRRSSVGGPVKRRRLSMPHQRMSHKEGITDNVGENLELDVASPLSLEGLTQECFIGIPSEQSSIHLTISGELLN